MDRGWKGKGKTSGGFVLVEWETDETRTRTIGEVEASRENENYDFGE